MTEKEAELINLDRDEKLVLFLICEDREITAKEIATKLDLKSRSEIGLRLTNIYKNLRLREKYPYLKHTELRKKLASDYCATFSQLYPSIERINQEAVEKSEQVQSEERKEQKEFEQQPTSVQSQAQEEITEPIVEKEQIPPQEKELEDTQPIAVQEEEPEIIHQRLPTTLQPQIGADRLERLPPPPTPPPSTVTLPAERHREEAAPINLRPFFTAGVIIGLLLIGYFVVRNLSAIFRPPDRLAQTASTATRPVPPTRAATKTPNPYSILRYTQTYIAKLSNTPSPPPPLKTPLPGVTLPFTDEFSKGIDPAWVIQGEQPYLVNDALTTAGSTWLYIGNDEWKNYTVDFTTPLGLETQDLGLRMKNDETMILLKFNDANISLHYLNDGIQTEIPGTNTSFNLKRHEGMHYIVTLRDDNIIVQVNETGVLNVYLSSELSEMYNTGGVSLHLEEGALVNYFRILPQP